MQQVIIDEQQSDSHRHLWALLQLTILMAMYALGPSRAAAICIKTPNPQRPKAHKQNNTLPVFRRSHFDHLSCSQFCALGNARELSIKSVAIFMCDTYIPSVSACAASNRWNMAPSESHRCRSSVCMGQSVTGRSVELRLLQPPNCAVRCAQNLCYVYATARSGPGSLS